MSPLRLALAALVAAACSGGGPEARAPAAPAPEAPAAPSKPAPQPEPTWRLLGLLEMSGRGNAWAEFSADGAQLLTHSGSVELWTAAGGHIRSFGEASLARLTPKGDRLVTLTGRAPRGGEKADGPYGLMAVLRVHTLDGATAVAIDPAHESDRASFWISPDGAFIAVAASLGSGDGDVKVWDVRSRKQVSRFRKQGSWVDCVAFAPDGKELAICSESGVSRHSVDGLRDRKPLDLYEDDGIGADAAVYSPDGGFLFVVQSDHIHYLLDRASDRLVYDTNPAGMPAADAWNADLTRLAAARIDGKVELFDGREGTRTATLDSGLIPSAMAMSRDGSTLAVGGRNGRVMLWDIRTMRKLAELAGHDGELVGLAFHPAASALVSWSKSGPMRLWASSSR